MKLKKYLKYLQKLLEENPHLKDAEIYFSADDEGNGYQKVSYTPSIRFIEEGTEDNYYQDSLESKKTESMVPVVLIN